ncbi:MAG TPA: hypothetical protein DEQ03_16390 [Marinilabiliales bacterium]|nr:hypothetical protein [Marinilabiliales bacterium]
MKQFLFITLFICFTMGFAVSQTLVINEFSSLNSTLLDEDSDTPDWIELYNAGSSILDLTGWSLTDDSALLTKWKLPALTLNPGKTLLLFASGKDRKQLTYYHTLVNWGDIFSYTIGSSSIPQTWKNLDYDDSQWSKGSSGIGYADNDDATIIPEGTLSVYTRIKFTVPQLADLNSLLLHVDYDDGFVAYLNGTEIARTNLGTANTTVLYNQLADNYVEPLIVNGQAPKLFDLSTRGNLLVEGENVLCIQIHNNSSTSSDLTLIPFLTAGYNNPIADASVPEVLRLSNKLMHANFKIGADGEDILLVSPQGTITDRTDSIALPMDVSYGRKPDGTGDWFYFGEPTPGNSNTTNAYDSISNQQIEFSPMGELYSSSKQIILSAHTGDTIYYTTDGTEPSRSSQIYSGPITITQTKAIRAKSFGTNALSNEPSIQTYIIANRDVKLPIVSLTTEPKNLFDYNYGIYADGPNWTSDNPHFGANYWMDWERPIHLEYFNAEGEKVFSAPAGTKIFGAWSRANAQKSMALYAREAYGVKRFNYPFFRERENDSYNSLVLRNSGNDWGSTTFRDAMQTGLLSELDIDRQAYQPVVVYINGEYWGILNLREKVNEKFIADLHPEVDPDKVDILEADGVVVEGYATHYQNMLNYLGSNDITKSTTYEYIKTQMEVINFMDYEIAQIYINNTDWPGNNIKYWRPQTTDGRWRWIIYDTDFGFGIWNTQDYANNTLEFALATNGPGWPNPPWSTYLLRTLVKNSTFKAEFINRFADRINYDFVPGRVNHFIDSLKANIAAEMPYHIAKWNHIGGWDGNVSNMKTFANNRPTQMRNFINSKFSLGGVVNLKVDVSDAEHGYVQVSSLRLKTYPWSGKYFKNNPVRVVAMAKPGYEFSHWEGIDSTRASVNLSIPTSGLTIKAVFKASVKEYNNVVINEINYKSATTHDCGDWVELFNTTNSRLDLSGWVFKDGDNAHGFVFPQGTFIDAGGFLVLYEDDVKFKLIYPNLTNVVGAFEFGLSGTEDALRLYDIQGNLTDSVLYMSDDPWPSISDDKGETLSLIDPYKNNEPYYRWEPSSGTGTPGIQNDNYNDINTESLTAPVIASCYPNPFNQQATVRWKCNQPTSIKIDVLDFKGARIETLFEGGCPNGTFESVWISGDYVSSGIYFVKIMDGMNPPQVLKLIRN